jgi:hypothetical protein
MSSLKHWSWGYFFTDGHFFRNNNSYKNAWCIACLNNQKELLRQSDILDAALSGTSSNRTDAEQEALGSYYLILIVLCTINFEAIINSNLCSAHQLPTNFGKTWPDNGTTPEQMCFCCTRR